MSETPSIELVPMSSHSDISGQVLTEETQPLAEVETQPLAPPQEDDTPTEPPENDTEDNDEDDDDDEEKPVNTEDDDLAAVALGSILVLGGIILGGLALYMKNPLVIEHPWSRGDYF
jgi:hypothetical protein